MQLPRWSASFTFWAFLSAVGVASNEVTSSAPQQQGQHIGESSVNKQIDPWPPATAQHASIQDLSREYHTIFRHGNRNAASHLWSTFLLDRAPQMTLERLYFFFSGFCAVSGSQVRPSDYNRYRLTLPLVDGTTNTTGFMHYCCWPCVCDTQDFIRVDTLNVTSSDGIARQHFFAVIGNPCDHPERLEESFEQPFQYARGRPTTLSQVAPEVKCLEGGILKGATLSDHGYIIVGMFFDAVPSLEASDKENNVLQPFGAKDQVPGRVFSTEVPSLINADLAKDASDDNYDHNQDSISVSGSNLKTVLYQDERDWEHQCIDRAFQGYNSGMGEIFRRVSSISPIIIGGNTASLDDSSNDLDSNNNPPVHDQIADDPTCSDPVSTVNTQSTEAIMQNI